MTITEKVLDHGYVTLRNVSGPTRRPLNLFDGGDVDPAHAARMSFGKEAGRTREADLKLCEYLLRNRHTTPFEMVEVWLEMQLPLFLAAQIKRHRTARLIDLTEAGDMDDPSLNEMSGRYVEFPELFYVPEPSMIGVKAPTNKQGRIIAEDDSGLPSHHVREFCEDIAESSERGFAHYRRALSIGVPNELARLHLLPNTYTRWLYKQDLHNLMHFLSLRLDPHAQYEAREYARAVHRLLSSALPDTMALFDRVFPVKES